MEEPKLKISPSHIEATFHGKPHLKRYASQLRGIDKDQNGEVDLVELCEVLEELETSNRNRRLLKWVAIVTALFSLLTIAAIVGLTYAVVDLSKDTTVSNQSLVSKDTGETLATARAKQSVGLGSLVHTTPQELVDLESVILPMGNNRTQIMHVSDLELDPGVSLTLISPSGKSVTIAADGSISDVNATAPGGASRRRLLDNGSVGGGTAIVTGSSISSNYHSTSFSIPAGQLKVVSDPTNVGSTLDVSLYSITVKKCGIRRSDMGDKGIHVDLYSYGDDFFTLDNSAGQGGVSLYGIFVKDRANGEVLRFEYDLWCPDIKYNYYDAGCSEYYQPLPGGSKVRVLPTPGGIETAANEGDTLDVGMRLLLSEGAVVHLYWPKIEMYQYCS
jgi:hypothetical protein